MSDRQNDKSFWATLLGILTGLAAVLTAIATLVGVLVAAHVISIPSSAEPLSVSFEPNPVRPGDEVRLHLSTPLPQNGIGH